MNANALPPGENISEKQLKLGYWFVTHKLQLKKGLVFALLFTGAALILFTLYMLVRLYLVDYTGFRQMERQMILNLVNPAAVEAALPRSLAIRPVQIFDGSSGAQDALIEVANPNGNYWASWTGRFNAANTTTTAKTAFILPGETKSIVDLGLESRLRLTGVRYEMTDLKWHKIDRHQIPDYQKYFADHFRFDIQNIKFASEPSPDQKSVIARVSFDVTNRSAWSYWSVGFATKLFRGTSLAAVNSVELQQFETGETRHVEEVWVQDLQAISKVEVTPAVNILDPKVFMPQRS